MPIGGKERLHAQRLDMYGRLRTEWLIKKVTDDRAEAAAKAAAEAAEAAQAAQAAQTDKDQGESQR